jgi:hypothetical protein
MMVHELLALDYPREHVFPEELSMSNEHQPPPPPTQFGVFYPLGHVVVALESQEDAERMRQLLIDGGYDEHDVTLWTGPQVATGARELQQSASVIAKIFGAELPIFRTSGFHDTITLLPSGIKWRTGGRRMDHGSGRACKTGLCG